MKALWWIVLANLSTVLVVQCVPVNKTTTTFTYLGPEMTPIIANFLNTISNAVSSLRSALGIPEQNQNSMKEIENYAVTAQASSILLYKKYETFDIENNLAKVSALNLNILNNSLNIEKETTNIIQRGDFTHIDFTEDITFATETSTQEAEIITTQIIDYIEDVTEILETTTDYIYDINTTDYSVKSKEIEFENETNIQDDENAKVKVDEVIDNKKTKSKKKKPCVVINEKRLKEKEPRGFFETIYFWLFSSIEEFETITRNDGDCEKSASDEGSGLSSLEGSGEHDLNEGSELGEHIEDDMSSYPIYEGSGEHDLYEGSGLGEHIEDDMSSYPIYEGSGEHDLNEGSGLREHIEGDMSPYPIYEGSGEHDLNEGSGLGEHIEDDMSSYPIYEGSGEHDLFEGSGLGEHIEDDMSSYPIYEDSGTEPHIEGSGVEPNIEGSGVLSKIEGSGISELVKENDQNGFNNFIIKKEDFKTFLEGSGTSDHLENDLSKTDHKESEINAEWEHTIEGSGMSELFTNTDVRDDSNEGSGKQDIKQIISNRISNLIKDESERKNLTIFKEVLRNSSKIHDKVQITSNIVTDISTNNENDKTGEDLDYIAFFLNYLGITGTTVPADSIDVTTQIYHDYDTKKDSNKEIEIFEEEGSGINDIETLEQTEYDKLESLEGSGFGDEFDKTITEPSIFDNKSTQIVSKEFESSSIKEEYGVTKTKPKIFKAQNLRVISNDFEGSGYGNSLDITQTEPDIFENNDPQIISEEYEGSGSGYLDIISKTETSILENENIIIKDLEGSGFSEDSNLVKIEQNNFVVTSSSMVSEEYEGSGFINNFDITQTERNALGENEKVNILNDELEGSGLKDKTDTMKTEPGILEGTNLKFINEESDGSGLMENTDIIKTEPVYSEGNQMRVINEEIEGRGLIDETFSTETEFNIFEDKHLQIIKEELEGSGLMENIDIIKTESSQTKSNHTRVIIEDFEGSGSMNEMFTTETFEDKYPHIIKEELEGSGIKELPEYNDHETQYENMYIISGVEITTLKTNTQSYEQYNTYNGVTTTEEWSLSTNTYKEEDNAISEESSTMKDEYLTEGPLDEEGSGYKNIDSREYYDKKTQNDTEINSFESDSGDGDSNETISDIRFEDVLLEGSGMSDTSLEKVTNKIIDFEEESLVHKENNKSETLEKGSGMYARTNDYINDNFEGSGDEVSNIDMTDKLENSSLPETNATNVRKHSSEYYDEYNDYYEYYKNLTSNDYGYDTNVDMTTVSFNNSYFDYSFETDNFTHINNTSYYYDYYHDIKENTSLQLSNNSYDDYYNYGNNSDYPRNVSAYDYDNYYDYLNITSEPSNYTTSHLENSEYYDYESSTIKDYNLDYNVNDTEYSILQHDNKSILQNKSEKNTEYSSNFKIDLTTENTNMFNNTDYNTSTTSEKIFVATQHGTEKYIYESYNNTQINSELHEEVSTTSKYLLSTKFQFDLLNETESYENTSEPILISNSEHDIKKTETSSYVTLSYLPNTSHDTELTKTNLRLNENDLEISDIDSDILSIFKTTENIQISPELLVTKINLETTTEYDSEVTEQISPELLTKQINLETTTEYDSEVTEKISPESLTTQINLETTTEYDSEVTEQISPELLMTQINLETTTEYDSNVTENFSKAFINTHRTEILHYKDTSEKPETVTETNVIQKSTVYEMTNIANKTSTNNDNVFSETFNTTPEERFDDNNTQTEIVNQTVISHFYFNLPEIIVSSQKTGVNYSELTSDEMTTQSPEITEPVQKSSESEHEVMDYDEYVDYYLKSLQDKTTQSDNHGATTNEERLENVDTDESPLTTMLQTTTEEITQKPTEAPCIDTGKKEVFSVTPLRGSIPVMISIDQDEGCVNHGHIKIEVMGVSVKGPVQIYVLVAEPPRCKKYYSPPWGAVHLTTIMIDANRYGTATTILPKTLSSNSDINDLVGRAILLLKVVNSQAFLCGYVEHV